MILTPIIVMNVFLVIMAILLAIADYFLVNYGECKITVSQGDEKKEIKITGGGNLLTALSENNIKISSSCGGKATCGYCKVKVLSGESQILPTEEIFMTREEKLSGMRLACQVKIKKDIEIYIPDFLETVRTIVQKRTYDPKMRWKFNILNQTPVPADDKKIVPKFDENDRLKVQEIIDKYKNIDGAIVSVLQKVTELYNYLPEPALRFVSEGLNLPFSLVHRVATFYNAFSLDPIGKYVITVCTGTACHVRGAEKVITAFEDELGIKRGGTTPDMLFSLKTVRCLGCCGLAPVLKVGEDIHGLMTKKKVTELIKLYKTK